MSDNDVMKNERELAPIVLFVYNRPLHTRQTLEALSRNSLADQSKLFVFADGLDTDAEGENVTLANDVETIVLSKPWCKEVTLIKREQNFGLADNIVSGVSEIINRYGKVIVLEDDLITSPGFLQFMNDALDVYQDDLKVMHVSGYMFPVKGELPEIFFYRQTSCWGWATWKRAWQHYNNDPDDLLNQLKTSNKVDSSDIDGTNQFIRQLESNIQGLIKTWAVKWHFSVELADGLSLHPGQSLVRNIGLDGSGVNCGISEKYDVSLMDRVIVRRHPVADYKKVYPLLKAFHSSPVKSKRNVKGFLFNLLPSSLRKQILPHINKSVKQKIAEEYRLKNLPRFTATTTTFLGKKLLLSDAASFLSTRGEIFQAEIYKFIASNSRPVILDCGANIGLSVLYFKQLYPNAEIIAFEPDRKIFEVLRQNVKNFDLDDVTIINKGLWNKETTLRFYSEGADAGRIARPTDIESIIEIETISLRPFLQRKIDFLKIDIEGAEVDVLYDCKDLLKNVRHLFVEYHSYLHEEQRLDELLSLLRDAGFRYSIQQHGVVSMTPFITIKTQSSMDILLNISAYRVKSKKQSRAF